jgi:hypothetical protein
VPAGQTTSNRRVAVPPVDGVSVQVTVPAACAAPRVQPMVRFCAPEPSVAIVWFAGATVKPAEAEQAIPSVAPNVPGAAVTVTVEVPVVPIAPAGMVTSAVPSDMPSASGAGL